LVFQDPETQFFNLDVETEVAYGPESLGLPPSEIESRLNWALEKVGMDGFRSRSPFSLSGGEKQRIAIAAILSMRPKVLVLDEPTTSLDPRGAEEVFRTLTALRQQSELAVIFISQDSERVAEFSDRVIALEAGSIATQGTVKDVFSQVQLLERLGIRMPQVNQLADCLNRSLGTGYSFFHLDQAVHVLAQDLERRRFR
jgi:energy-coupling factor transport system ATP-binding protein